MNFSHLNYDYTSSKRSILRYKCSSMANRFYLIPLCLILSLIVTAESSAAKEISGEYRLLEHTGRTVDKHSYDGKLRLVFFGFTDCPLICPTTMAVVAQVMRLIESSEKKVQPLFITINPQVDTVDRLTEYVQAFHPLVIGLTGTDEQIRDAASGFNATFGNGKGDNPEIFHSSYLYLMDSDGEFLDLFGYGTDALTIATRLRQYLCEQD